MKNSVYLILIASAVVLISASIETTYALGIRCRSDR